MNLLAGQGVAVREVVMAPGHGRVDYLLYLDKQVVGVVEAKPEGTSLFGVEWQSAMYATGLPVEHRKRAVVLDGRRSCSRRGAVRPTSPTAWTRSRGPAASPADPNRALSPAGCATPRPTVSAHLAGQGAAPSAAGAGAPRRPPRSAVSRPPWPAAGTTARWWQMATGAGKTYTAVSECYRLLKHGGMRRILFLVDRTNLGEQIKGEFEGFVTPDDGHTFTELYPTALLTGAGMLESTSVVISTIQRVHAALQGRTTTADDDRTSTATCRIRRSRCRTRPPCRRRASTSSSSTSATGPSTASGGACSSTSTRICWG